MNPRDAVLGAQIDTATKMLFALNAKANRTGSPVFEGVSPDVRARRRAAGRVARTSRRANRGG